MRTEIFFDDLMEYLHQCMIHQQKMEIYINHLKEEIHFKSKKNLNFFKNITFTLYHFIIYIYITINYKRKIKNDIICCL